MGKQSSRIYGIKVKEHRNYFEYPAENPEIKIYYDANASKQWIIKSNYNSIWYNGQSYPSGYTVISFKDGTDCQNNPFMLMAPHEEDGIIVNYFYRITGRFTSYPQIELNEEFDISEETVIPEPTENESDDIRYTIESGRPGNHYSQLYVRKFINNEEVGHTIVTPESINAYKVAHSSNYYNYLKVFNALLFDWRGMAPSIYEEPYSFILYSNVTYLEWNGITRMRHTKITEWTWDTEVNMDIQDFSRQYDPVEPSDKDVIKYDIASNSNNSEIINVQKMVNNSVVVTKSVSKNDILSYKNTNHGDPLRVFDNLLFDCLQLPESYPNYTFIIKADNSYLKYDGDWVNYGNDIVSWPTNAFVNFEIEDYSNRYEQQVLEGDNYNVYIEHIKWNSQHQYWVNVDSPIALTKDEVCYDIFYDHKEMYYNNHYHKAAWLVYDQPSEGYKKIGKLAIMYADPFWVLITTADGIYWNGHTYKGRKLLKMWKDDEAVDLTMKRTESRKKTTFGNEYDRIRYTVITNNGDSKIKLTKYINDIKSTESTFNPLTTEQRTFSGIVLYCVDTSVILMYSKSDDLTVDGIPYTTNEKIGEWLISEKVSYSINDKDYQKVNYVITTSELNNTITLIKQINDLEDDTVVFDPETDCPLNFYNIRFAYSNGKVSVYSKCDYIKLSGSTYKNGNLITDWPLEEKVNFAIQDESDKYEVTKTTTYTVKTENVTETDYDIITLMDEHWTPLKICKINNGRTSNEEIVNFYDCQYEPYFNYDDKLQLIYDPATTYWTLKSLSDEIYKDNVNYPEGSVIDTWPYGTDKHIYGVGHQDISHYEIRLHSVEVDSKASYETTHEYITNPTYTIITQPDHSLDVTNNQPGSLPVTRNIRYMDAIDWYTFFGLKIKYNTTTSEWEVKAGNNLIVVGQILYKKGDIVSKWNYYEDVDKTINTLVEDIKHTTRDDKEKDILVSSKNFWLYGYIWQKEETPPPGPWPSGYIGDIIIIQDPSDNRWGTLCYIIPNELYHRKILPSTSRQPWLRIYLSEFSYFFNTENEFYVPFGVNEIFWYCSVSASNDYIFQTQRRMTTSFYIPQTQGYFNNFDMVGKFIEKESCVSIYSLGTYGDLGDRWLFLIMKAEYSSSGWINVQYQQAIDIAVYDWQQALQTDFDQLNGAGYVIWASYMNPYTKVNSLNKAVYFCCPRLNLNVDLFKYLTFRFYQETLSLIEIPSSITNEIKSSVVPHHEKNIEVNVRTIYFNNTFYLIIYAGVHENFNGNGSYYPPETWDNDYFISPHVFLLTYNDISGFHLYNLDNDVFGTADRVSPILETPIGAGRSYYVLEKYYSVPTRLYTYQNELYISDIRYDEIVDGDLGKSIVYKRCIYKLDEQNHTFIKVKEFKIEDTISVYDIVNKENVEINICQFLLRYDFITHNSENFTHLEHIQNVSRSLRRKDLVNGLYFIYLKNRTQTIYYFTNPLFDEDIMNFCFPANEIGFRDRYSEDGNF